MFRRHGNKWNVNEYLRLQREWELLDLSVEEIAELHERSNEAIMWKLVSENFATPEEVYNRLKKKSKKQKKY
jgi:hypothetical protein